MSRNFQAVRAHAHPLPELLVLTVTKPVREFTNFEHLLVGKVLEEFKRIKRTGDPGKE